MYCPPTLFTQCLRRCWDTAGGNTWQSSNLWVLCGCRVHGVVRNPFRSNSAISLPGLYKELCFHLWMCVMGAWWKRERTKLYREKAKHYREKTKHYRDPKSHKFLCFWEILGWIANQVVRLWMSPFPSCAVKLLGTNPQSEKQYQSQQWSSTSW